MENSAPIQRILIGVDAEGLAANAIIQGFALAGELDAKMDLVLALPAPYALWPGITQDELNSIDAAGLAAAKCQAIQALEPLLERAGLKPDLDRLLQVFPGTPGKVLLQKAEEFGSDLIIIGQHAKRSGLDFGSTARNVFAHSKIPVWCQAGTPSPIKSILLPVDFSDQSERAARFACSLARSCGAAIQAVHCFEPPSFVWSEGTTGVPGPTYVVDQIRDAEEEHLNNWVADYAWNEVPIQSKFLEGQVVPSLVAESAAHDLVIMGSQGRTGLSRFLLGGVAYGVLKGSETSVLVIPSKTH